MSERAPHLILGLEKMHFNRLYKKFSMLNLSNRWLRNDWIIAEKYLQIKKNPTCQWILSSSGCQLIQSHSTEGQDPNVWRWLWLMPGTDSQERRWSHLFVSVNQVAHCAVFGQPHAMLVFSTSNWVKCGVTGWRNLACFTCGSVSDHVPSWNLILWIWILSWLQNQLLTCVRGKQSSGRKQFSSRSWDTLWTSIKCQGIVIKWKIRKNPKYKR